MLRVLNNLNILFTRFHLASKPFENPLFKLKIQKNFHIISELSSKSKIKSPYLIKFPARYFLLDFQFRMFFWCIASWREKMSMKRQRKKHVKALHFAFHENHSGKIKKIIYHLKRWIRSELRTARKSLLIEINLRKMLIESRKCSKETSNIIFIAHSMEELKKVADKKSKQEIKVSSAFYLFPWCFKENITICISFR